MLNVKLLLPYRTLPHRFFSTSLPLCGGGPPYRSENYVLENRGRYKIYPEKVFYKLLYAKHKKTSFLWRPPVGLPAINIQTAASCLSSHKMVPPKRVLVLNKLFMRYIPEILATSAIGVELMGRDVQFSHVKLAADYSVVRMYWIPKGEESDEEVQKLLDKVAGPLQKEMIASRIMGIVPKIRFCKDKFQALMAEVDRRLKIADFGEDFVPTVFTEDILKRQLQLHTTLPIEIKGKLMELENVEPICENEEVKIPEMAMNTFNLNYQEIQRTIADGCKNKRIAKLALEDEMTLLGKSCVKEVSFSDEAQESKPLERQAFLKYIRKKKTERKKLLKEEAKEFKKQALLDSTLQDDDVQEDELYIEFVKNQFEDHFEELDVEERLESEI